MGSTPAQWLNFEPPCFKGFFLCGVCMISPCPYVFPLGAELETLNWNGCVGCLSVSCVINCQPVQGVTSYSAC